MIFLSILAKTCAIALAPFHPAAAALVWALGLAADVFAFRAALRPDAEIEAGAKSPTPVDVLRQTAIFNIAALVIGFAVAAGCDYAAMRWKLGIPLVSHLLAGFLHLFGVPAAAAGGNIYLTTMAGPLEMAASIDHLALRTPVVFLALCAAWLLRTQSSLARVFRNLAALAGLMFVVAIVRAGCVALLFLALSEFVGYDAEELPFRPFAEESVAIWTWLPFLLVVWALAARMLGKPRLAGRAPVGLPRLVRWGAAPLFFIAFCVVLWKPTGTPKSGRVVIDTFHTQWSRTDRPYDRDWYGADSGYNYACLKRLFEVFYPVQESRARLDPETLKGASMLVIYTPDKQYTEEEIRTIRGFVREGGGLLVIGDHTNVFGSTSNLNELCSDFGFQFRDDVLFDLDEDFHQVIDPPKWPSRSIRPRTTTRR